MGAVYTPSEIIDPPSGTKQDDQRLLLWQIVTGVLSPPYMDKTLNRARGTVIIESGTVTTVTTCSTVTTITNLNTVPAHIGAISENYDAWCSCVRNRIT